MVVHQLGNNKQKLLKKYDKLKPLWFKIKKTLNEIQKYSKYINKKICIQTKLQTFILLKKKTTNMGNKYKVAMPRFSIIII